MEKATYEFRYVSSKHKVQLILWKGSVIIFMLALLGMMVFTDEQDIGQNLSRTSGVLQGVFCYINLMRVQAEVKELFEPPVQFKGSEFFWLAMVTLVASFLV